MQPLFSCFKDTLFLQNAAASTYAWGIPDLSFHRLPDCSDTAMLFAQPGLSGRDCNQRLHVLEETHFVSIRPAMR